MKVKKQTILNESGFEKIDEKNKNKHLGKLDGLFGGDNE